jgi:hypothetical protein
LKFFSKYYSYIQNKTCCPTFPKVNYHEQWIKIKTQKPYFLVCDATLPLLLLSPFDFPEFAFGCAEPLGIISLIMWEQSSLNASGKPQICQSHWRVRKGQQWLFLYQGHGGPQFSISF